MADLMALFAQAEREVNQAVATAGTKLMLTEEVSSTDDESLETETWVEERGEFRAIVIKAALMSGLVDLSPGVELRSSDWVVIATSSTETPAEGTFLTVLESRGGVLTGDKAKILGSMRDSSGAYLRIFARPQWGGAQ